MSEDTAKKTQTEAKTQLGEGATNKSSAIPQGLAKSGRVWKENQKQKSSLYASDGANPLRTSWELKQEKRMKEKRMKELERSITEARIETKRAKRKAIEERNERRAQNEMKSAKVQVISDANKLKRMSKKQLKQIKKTRVDKNGNVIYVDAYAK
ncbi:hypothetical protein BLSTO_00020 [Blastocystis sp. subtype 1]